MNKRKRKYSKQRRYKNMKRLRVGRLALVISVIVLVILGIIKLINKFPESITIDMKMTEVEEERIRDIIRQELNDYENRKNQEKVTQQENTIQEQQQQIEQLQQQLSAKKEAEEQERLRLAQVEKERQQVTSRGGVMRTQEQSSGTSLGTYRLTHYYPGDGMQSSNKTGSGKTTANFSITNINGAQVYTYQGKVVLAAWTQELKKTGYNQGGAQSKDTYIFHYNQIVQIKIAGQWYEGIILDSCGAAGWQSKGNLVDLFVPSAGNSPATTCEIKI